MRKLGTTRKLYCLHLRYFFWNRKTQKTMFLHLLHLRSLFPQSCHLRPFPLTHYCRIPYRWTKFQLFFYFFLEGILIHQIHRLTLGVHFSYHSFCDRDWNFHWIQPSMARNSNRHRCCPLPQLFLNETTWTSLDQTPHLRNPRIKPDPWHDCS